MVTDNDASANKSHEQPASNGGVELPDEIFDRLFGDDDATSDTDDQYGPAGDAHRDGASPAEDGAITHNGSPEGSKPLQSAASTTGAAPAGQGAGEAGRSPASGRKSASRSGMKGAAEALLEKVTRAVNRKSSWTDTASTAGSQSMGSPCASEDDADPEAAMSEGVADDLERRLKVSLRETALGGIGRVAVGSPKGGVGKSSLAYAIAGAVSYYTNMRVVLVDADPNFGSTRLLVPRPIEPSLVELARDADGLAGLADLRGYIAQNEKMRLDVVLGPKHAYELAEFDDLGAAYERIDTLLSRHYDVIVYDLGLGFRDPAIRSVLDLCNELLFVTDSEVIPNAMLSDGITYVRNLGVDLARTTLVLNHRLPPEHESAATDQVRTAHTQVLRRVTEVPYDASMSQLLNRRAFHIESLSQATRLGILTTLAACLEGLRSSAESGVKVSSVHNEQRR